MSIDVWFQLVIICLLGAMSPGPSLVLVVNNTFVGGKTYGIITSLAHGLGIGIWAFLTAIGVSGLLIVYVKSTFGGILFIVYLLLEIAVINKRFFYNLPGIPPSILIISPVINSESLLAKNNAVFATFSGLPGFFNICSKSKVALNL